MAAGKHPAMRVWQREPLNVEAAPDLLAASDITELRAFYVRSHGPVPAINAAAHQITVSGLVRTPLELDLDGLRSLCPQRSVTATLQCAGNRRSELIAVRPIEGEIPWGPGVIGTAVWCGVSLADLLTRAGVRADATHVELIGEDVDPDGRSFGGSIPLAKALSGEVLLADRMNGEPLCAAHGAPLRAVVPGYIGARSVKWLREINLLSAPSPNYYQAVAYRVHPPSVTDRDADPSAAIPLGELAVNAAILTPCDGADLAAGNVTVTGYAISGGANRVERVDVTVDDGASWQCADLLDAPSPWAWRRWRLTLDLPAGRRPDHRPRDRLLAQHPARESRRSVERAGIRKQREAQAPAPAALEPPCDRLDQPVTRSTDQIEKSSPAPPLVRSFSSKTIKTIVLIENGEFPMRLLG